MKSIVSLLLVLCSFHSFAQIEDCVGAYPVCGNGDISLVPTGVGVDDFANPKNATPDCFVGSSGSKTTWLRLKIKQGGSLGFTIIPIDRTGPDRDDYDFAVYKSNDCNNLGRSIRCSTTNPQNANVGAETGLSPNETENSEGPGADGNGFVRWLENTRVGEVYFVFIDNFSQDKGYTLQWEGTALLEDRITKEEGGVDLGPDQNLCDNDTLVLDATIVGGVRYEWNTGNRNPQLTVEQAGTYSVTVTNSAGCVSTDEIIITEIPAPIIDEATVTPNNICEPTDVVFNAKGSTGLYEWFNPSGAKIGEGSTLSLSNLNANDSGSYKVKLTRDNGCTDEQNVDLVIHPLPQLSLSGRVAYCEKESINISVAGAQDYIWLNPAGQEINTTSNWTKNSAQFSDVGEYTIIGTSQFGCQSTTKFSITVEPELSIAIVTENQNLCESDTVTLQAQVNNPNANVQWFNPSNQQVGNGLELNLLDLKPESTGFYTVVATNALGCQDKDSVNVKINPTYLFENAFTQCPGDFFTIPQTGEVVKEDKIVRIELLTVEQCDSTYVYDINFLDCGEEVCSGFPTSFAPNSNATNEQFRPIFSPNCIPSEFVLDIYNRWGQKVATINNAQQGWDGTFNGKPAMPDVYTWQMQYRFTDNPDRSYNKTGSITLIR